MNQPTEVYNYYFKYFIEHPEAMSELYEVDNKYIYKFTPSSKLVPLYAYFVPSVQFEDRIFLPRITLSYRMKTLKNVFMKSMFYEENNVSATQNIFRSCTLDNTTIENCFWLLQDRPYYNYREGTYVSKVILGGVFVSGKTFFNVNPKELSFDELIFGLSTHAPELPKMKAKLYTIAKKCLAQVICTEDFDQLLYPIENKCNPYLEAEKIEPLTRPEIKLFADQLTKEALQNLKPKALYIHPPLSLYFIEENLLSEDELTRIVNDHFDVFQNLDNDNSLIPGNSLTPSIIITQQMIDVYRKVVEEMNNAYYPF